MREVETVKRAVAIWLAVAVYGWTLLRVAAAADQRSVGI